MGMTDTHRHSGRIVQGLRTHIVFVHGRYALR